MRLEAPQPVTFVELFFDLVFVFAVTQVTAVVGRRSDDRRRAPLAGSLLADLVGVDAVHLDAQPGRRRRIAACARSRSIATATAFVMATRCPRRIRRRRAVVRRPLRRRPRSWAWRCRCWSSWSARRRITAPSGAGSSARWSVSSLVLVGAVADPELRPWFWAGGDRRRPGHGGTGRAQANGHSTRRTSPNATGCS